MDLYLLSGVLNDKVEVIEDTEDGIKYYTKALQMNCKLNQNHKNN